MKPVTIRLSAVWCSPCKAYAPVFEGVATENPNVDFYHVDVDEEPELAQAFGVKSVPTTIFIPNDGSQPQSTPGALPKTKLSEMIKEVLHS